jgi:hypothetical protein
MSWQTTITPAEASAECPHCGLIMPVGWLVCRACSRDVSATPGGFELKRAVWTAEGHAAATLPRKPNGPTLAELLAEVPAVIAARRAVLAFLKLHSSAL